MANRLSQLALLALVSVCLMTTARGQISAPDANLDNIALGVPYSLQPQPAYRYCTDPGDSVQLTDGIETTGYFWTEEGTVGWANHRNVIVTLDLGQDVAIRGVSLRTAAGTAGAAWPSGLRVFLAGEDKVFREAADLLGLSIENGTPPTQSYNVHKYWTDAMKAHGRYVAIVVSNTPYIFMDEIEVYAGDPAWLTVPVRGEQIEDMVAYVDKSQTQDGIARRLRQDIAVVRKRAVAENVPKEVRESVLSKLDAIGAASQAENHTDYTSFRAVLPLDKTHAQLFSCQAELWRAEGFDDFLLWQSDLWAPLNHLTEPPRDANPHVGVAMMDNEYRAASLNITNTSENPHTLHLDIQGLPGGTNPDYITAHEVAWTDTTSGVPVASALPPARRDPGGKWLISVPAGMTRQVWFTFHPQGVEAGRHEGHLVLTNADWIGKVPLTFHRYPFRFPDEPTLNFGGWDYTDGDGHRGINPGNRDAVIADLVDHYVNSPWATSQVIPKGTHDANGHMTSPPDTARFDEWTARWPGAKNYCIFAAVNNRFNSWIDDTPEFAIAVGEWSRFWAAHARSKGISPERLCILLLDEPHEPAQDEIIIAWAKAMAAADSGLTIWEDPTFRGVSESQSALAKVCNVLCPNRPIFLRSTEAYRDFFRGERDGGTTLEFYSCTGPTTLLDPYAYFRLQAWTCWKEGAAASYFWAFGDNAGGSSWNEYKLPRAIYTLTYLDDTSVTPAKMLEAAREGVEDYEYFVMLEAAIETAPEGPEKVAAQTLLNTLPVAVLETGTSDGLMWHDKLDRRHADKARSQILEALQSLSLPQ